MKPLSPHRLPQAARRACLRGRALLAGGAIVIFYAMCYIQPEGGNYMRMLLDASAIMAVILEEPGRKVVENMVTDAAIISPDVLPFEIGNGLTKLMKRGLLSEADMQNAFAYYSAIPIELVEVDVPRSLTVAWEHSIYAYDAYYLELAERMSLPLVTLDQTMKTQAKKRGITVLEEENAGA
jgi:predicted nucleic acid-binding protein